MRIYKSILFIVAVAGFSASCSTTTTPIATTPESVAIADEAPLTDYDAAWVYGTSDVFATTLLALGPPPSVTRATVAVFDPTAAAAASASGAGSYFTPTTCVQASSSGAVASFVLNGCDGPLGLKSLTGTLTATFSMGSSGPQEVLTSNSISVDGVVYNVNTTVGLSASGNNRTAALTSTTVRANSSVTRVFNGTMTWTQGSGCIALNGTGTYTLNGTKVTTALNNYQRCTGQCPSAGTLSTQSPTGGSATLTYDNTSSPTYTDTSGANGNISINCP